MTVVEVGLEDEAEDEEVGCAELVDAADCMSLMMLM